jgi:hypothetical protein
MPVIQTFDTFIADPTTGGSFLVQSLPSASLTEQYTAPDRDVAALTKSLGITTIALVELAGSGLPRILARMLAAPELYSDFSQQPLDSWWQSVLTERRALAEFVEEVSYRPLIPTEMSPLELRSLSDIATGSVVVIGLVSGNPVLVISGLVGIIVVRAVNGLAKGAERAFEEAGYEWTHRLLRLHRNREH